jgi:hypothetical protein
METTESAELFRKSAKLKSPGPGVETGVLKIVEELGDACVGDRAGGIQCRSDITVKVGHPLVPAGISRTTETVIGHEGKCPQHAGDLVRGAGAVVGDGGAPTQLAGFSEFWRIFPALFERLTGEEKLATAVSRVSGRSI